MLKKKICKKCWNKGYIANGEKLIWAGFDDENWKLGMIYCPKEYREKGKKPERKITEPPPIKCPFLLEHILTQGNKCH